jgi:heme exporter protein D
MIWTSLDDFLAMGGYGFYVWGSAGAFLACLVVEWIGLEWRRAGILAELTSVRRNDPRSDA